MLESLVKLFLSSFGANPEYSSIVLSSVLGDSNSPFNAFSSLSLLKESLPKTLKICLGFSLKMFWPISLNAIPNI